MRRAGWPRLVGADVLTLHAGGAAGGIAAALDRLERRIERLSAAPRARLALENDDRSFSPEMLLPLCERLGVPLVYDVHHHRCNPDALDVDEVTARRRDVGDARAVLPRSSPRAGFGGGDLRPHADYVDPADVPRALADDAPHGGRRSEGEGARGARVT